MVGVTTITLEYSRPGVKGRTIFGDVVPYNKLWRLGANACTKFTTNTDIFFGDSVLKAGTYALFAIPSENGQWTLIFNTDLNQSGTDNYNETKTILKVNSYAIKNSYNETLVIELNNITENTAFLSVKWDKLRVDFPFYINTDEFVQKNITEAIISGKDLKEVYYRAGYYYFYSMCDYTKSLDFVKKSLALEKMHNNTFLHAQIMYKTGKTKEAIKLADEAYELAMMKEAKGFAQFIASTTEEWKKNL